MRFLPLTDESSAARWASKYIVDRIKKFQPSLDRPFVLGLPTGGTPVATYIELIRLYQEGKISFKHVVTYNMDEYVGLPSTHPKSYRTFMREKLFNHIDIPDTNINYLDGNAEDLEAECARYEQSMENAGGVELFLGGVGRDGHIAFNEPGSSLASLTRIKTLTEDTRTANARFFDNDVSQVPVLALTVGVGTLLKAKEIVILATGLDKAHAVKATVEGSVNHMWSVSAIQLHPKSIMICDQPAVSELKVKTLRYFEQIEAAAIRDF